MAQIRSNALTAKRNLPLCGRMQHRLFRGRATSRLTDPLSTTAYFPGNVASNAPKWGALLVDLVVHHNRRSLQAARSISDGRNHSLAGGGVVLGRQDHSRPAAVSESAMSTTAETAEVLRHSGAIGRWPGLYRMDRGCGRIHRSDTLDAKRAARSPQKS
jgi:hypothetical protein